MKKTYSRGIFFNKPSGKTPDFVKGRINIYVNEFINFLKEHRDEGMVKLDLLKSKDDKFYFVLNDWKPEVPEDMEDKSEHMDFDETHRLDEKYRESLL